MKILVAFASRYGATAEIARELGDFLGPQGHEVAVLPVAQVSELDSYGAVIFGSAIQFGRWLNEAARFLIDNQKQLASKPLWVFSSGPTGEPLKPSDDNLGIERLKGVVSPRGHRIFAGSLDKTQLSFAETVVVDVAGLADGDYRDWAEVREWAAQIGDELRQLPVQRAVQPPMDGALRASPSDAAAQQQTAEHE